ncbi:hypothetical protein O7614_09750 [Micromonospora sp. WMMD961]|uniref:hypothetical protein n=1 Tax=Micromonospora sp. WMMD961 TaxID=3016100 RepID=UPI002415BFD3|nr:hypothetical protein [Micromonospora sp. WMMD961]MDG4779927.1 hypothetical protein [Micromonospora sp. WMMD961]
MTAPKASPSRDHQPLTGLHPVHQHLPRRPSWLCRVCAATWPCACARMLLRVEYGADRVALSIYMASQLFDATADLLKLNPEPAPDPRELFDRFLAWTAQPSV